MKKLKIVAISDTHGKWNKLVIPSCDILLSCGDFSFNGETHMIDDFHKWLDNQDARYIISVMGNHEVGVEENFDVAKKLAQLRCPNVHFIDEGLVEIEGIKIWGSAITPWFCDWAWNRWPGEIGKHWDKIPEDTDILITHGPPYGVLDTVLYADGTPKTGQHLGCPQLMNRIKVVKPDLHFFGHIHSGFGEAHIDGTSFYNASICDELYHPSNPITVVEYEYE